MSPHLDRASAWMISGALAFAVMSTLAHAVGPRCDWLVVALVRALMMLASAAALADASGSALVIWKPRTLWVRSLAGSFSLVCNFYALTRLPVSDAVTLINVHPLWIVLITSAARRRLPTRGEALGVACGMAGIYLIERPHFSGDPTAAVVAILSSLSAAVAMLGLHRLRQIDPRAVVAHFAGVASLVSLAWLALRGDLLSPRLFEGPTLLMLLGVGASGTVGQVLLTKAYAAGVPTRVAVVGLTQVVFAMLFEVAIWRRSLDPATIAGFALVLAPTTWLGVRSARAKASAEGKSEPLAETIHR